MALLIGLPGAELEACAEALRAGRFQVRLCEPPPCLADAVETDPAVCVLLPPVAELAEVETRHLRELYPFVPILVVNAGGAGETTVSLLYAGADDVVRPERVSAELTARLRSLRRRYAADGPPRRRHTLVAGDLEIDFGLHKVWLGGLEIPLSPTEFRILRQLTLHAGKVVPHEELLLAAWGEHGFGSPQALRVYIRQLRRKVQESHGVNIVNRPGIGYMLAAPS